MSRRLLLVLVACLLSVCLLASCEGTVYVVDAYVNEQMHLILVKSDGSHEDAGSMVCRHTTIETVPARAVTCTVDGLTEGQICSACGRIFIEPDVIPAKQHNFVNSICLNCGEREAQIEISGVVYKSDTDYDNANNEVLSGIKVIISGGSVYDECYTNDRGEYRFEVLSGTYTITIEASGFAKIEQAVTASSTNLELSNNIFMDIEQSSLIRGTVLIADADLNDSNNQPLGSAVVKLTKQSGTNSFELTQVTDDYGKYAFENLTAGIYKLTVIKDGYITTEQYVNVEERQTTVQNMSLEIIANRPNQGPGTVTGQILDAAKQGNVGVSGLSLQIRKGINNIVGQVVLVVRTNANGEYSINQLEPGNYTVTIIDERSLQDEAERYTSAHFNIKVIAGESIASQNGSVSNNAADVEMIQVKLSWGSTPSDLDSHLTGPTQSGGRFHVYYSSKQVANAGLDRDDTDSYGPETTTIDLREGADGIYRYSIHDFSNRGSTGSRSMASSNAKVEVYMAGVLKYTFYVPEGYGTLWTVFEYNSVTGVLTPINSMGYNTSDGGSVS